MFYIESRKTNLHYNLALEQFVFEKPGEGNDCFMLRQMIFLICFSNMPNLEA